MRAMASPTSTLREKRRHISGLRAFRSARGRQKQEQEQEMIRVVTGGEQGCSRGPSCSRRRSRCEKGAHRIDRQECLSAPAKTCLHKPTRARRRSLVHSIFNSADFDRGQSRRVTLNFGNGGNRSQGPEGPKAGFKFAPFREATARLYQSLSRWIRHSARRPFSDGLSALRHLHTKLALHRFCEVLCHAFMKIMLCWIERGSAESNF